MSLRKVSRGLVASVVILAACQDSPGPFEPSNGPSFSRSEGQDRMAAAFAKAWPHVLAVGGTVFADHDEMANRLVFGVENERVIPAVQNALSRAGISSADYSVRVTPPILNMATLRDRFRPTQGGIQIHFSKFLCTMGFNVSHVGGRSFITNSHCTARQGGTEGTLYYQPTSFVDPTVIATEADDPEYFRGGVCPKGRKCRFSDASRAAYSADVESNQGDILKTTGPNNNSITVDGVFTVTSQDNATTSFPIGMVVNKMGRTTGWTQGPVTNTCVHTNVFGSNVTQLCQTFVAARVGGGDSGSPVFEITRPSQDEVKLVGILWGGSGDGSSYVFSPFKQIQQELGALSATK
jgi:hypothetical protein